MKKILIIVLILFIVGCLTLRFGFGLFRNSDTIFGRISNILNRNNKIELTCSGIEKKNINIYWGFSEKGKLIIKSGKEINKIGHEYGDNGFLIKTHEDVEFQVWHFKFNNWHSHVYEINLKKDTSGYKIKFIANGPDFEWTEKHYDLSGRLNGIVCGYFKNGEYSYKGTFSLGLRQGQFIYYYSNGKIRSTVNYVDDEIHGFKTDFDENGNIKRKINYINGQKIKDHE